MSANSVASFSRCCKALADPTRVRVLRLLADVSTPLCVCEFKDALEETLYNVSRHLKELKQAGFIRGTKSGRWVYHALDPELSPMHAAMLNAVQLLTDARLAQDAGRLKKRLRLRQEQRCVIGPAESLRQAQQKMLRKKGKTHVRRDI